MARYMPDIEGPDFFKVYIYINGVETEVDVFVSKAATGEYYKDGWLNTTDPEFVFEGFDDDGKLLFFTMDQLALLGDVANEHFWNKVAD